MFELILERADVQALLKEIFNNPKYYNKVGGDILEKECTSHAKVLFIFYDAIYKYSLIIGDDKYLGEFISGIEVLIKRLGDVDNIKFGISKMLGKILAKSKNIPIELVEEHKEELLRIIYDNYILNGYYFMGVSKRDYLFIKENGYLKRFYCKELSEINKLLENYDFSIFNEVMFDMEFNTDFSKACFQSIVSPSALNNLLVNNNFVEDEKKSAYCLQSKKLCVDNLKTVLDKLKVSIPDSRMMMKLFENIWQIYNDSPNDIYLVMVKRNKVNSIDSFSVNSTFSYYDSLYNLFSTYDDYFITNRSDIMVDRCLELPNFTKYKKNLVLVNSIIDKDNFDIKNEYGVVSIFILFGSSLILLGVLFTLLFI